MELKELNERRYAVALEMTKLTEEAAKENKTFSAEDRQVFDNYDKEIVELDAQIETKKRSIRASEINDSKPEQNLYVEKTATYGRSNYQQFTESDKNNALRAWITYGSDEFYKPEYEKAAVKCGLNPYNKSISLNFGNKKLGQDEFSTSHQAEGTGSLGGDLVPTQELMQLVVRGMKQYGKLRNICKVLPTQNGHVIKIPTSDDTSNKAVQVSEGAPVSVLSVAFDQASLSAFKYGTYIPVSRELLEDAVIDVPSFLADVIAERMARGTEADYATGAGTTAPMGVLTTASVGVTTNHYTAITYNECLNWLHSVDPMYRDSDKSAFVLHDSAVKFLRQIVDGQSRPIFLPTLTTGLYDAPKDTLFGKPVYTNNSFQTVAAGNLVGAFGDWNRFWIRDVNSMILTRNDYLLGQTDETAFFAFFRTDSNMVAADNSSPITTLKMNASS